MAKRRSLAFLALRFPAQVAALLRFANHRMLQTKLHPQLKQKVGEASPPPASCSGNIERQMFDGFIPQDKAKHNGCGSGLVERSVRDREVAGSNPVNPTIFPDNQ